MVVCKDALEIEKMREAGRVVGQVLDMLVRMVQPGVRTLELDAAAEQAIRARGGVPTFKGYRGFPASICTSVNEEVVHGIPSRRVLREGDIVGLDCGATLDGYIGDAAVTVAVGRTSEHRLRLMEVTQLALQAAIAQAAAGNRLGDISHAIQATAENAACNVVREYCGHGVGREMHEPPQIPNYGVAGTGPRLGPGWTLAIEPMVNLGGHAVRVKGDGWTVVTADGSASAHYEHTVAITMNGPVVLTLP